MINTYLYAFMCTIILVVLFVCSIEVIKKIFTAIFIKRKTKP
jgi:hypothetical protein